MKTLFKILGKPGYLLLAIGVSLVVITFAAWLPNLHLVSRTIVSSSLDLGQKSNLLFGLLSSLQTNFTPVSLLVTTATAILAGIQLSLLVFYLRQKVALQQSMGVSAAGITASLLGIGCASCGSVLLTSVIGLGATTTALGVLPLKGQEFGLAGIALLSWAMMLTIRKINDPAVCKV
jgi:hypothetical protein